MQSVRVERFRSIRDATLNDLGDFSVLAGSNNAGKSNFLRALNLFYNGQVEPLRPLDIGTDYYRPERRSKKKKAIRVTVAFNLPDTFKFRKGLEAADQMLGREFTLCKEWTIGASKPAIYLNNSDAPVDSEAEGRVSDFLNLISYRYIPNRVIPTEVILREQQALRDVLIRRLASYRDESNQVFQRLQSTAVSLVNDVSREIRAMAPNITEIQLATPQSLADIAIQFGYRLMEDAIEVDETEQGSGMQSLLMFQTLHLIDRDYRQKFGWKQGAIWAVEEPESSLHTSLEAQVANFLHRVSNDPAGRLQIVATTHSDLMIQYADQGFYASKDEIGSSPAATTVAPQSPRDLLQQAARLGVSRWVNLFLYYPLDPIILVEGKTDRDFILEARRVLRLDDAAKLLCLEDLLGSSDRGGVDTLKRLVKDNAPIIRSRRSEAPIVIVLDWDAASKVGEFQKHFKPDDPFHVLVWPNADVNPKLHRSFGGIERFFPDRLIAEVECCRPNLIATKPNGEKTVQPEDYGTLKSELHRLVLTGLVQDDFQHAESFLRQLFAVASPNGQLALI